MPPNLVRHLLKIIVDKLEKVVYSWILWKTDVPFVIIRDIPKVGVASVTVENQSWYTERLDISFVTLENHNSLLLVCVE